MNRGVALLAFLLLATPAFAAQTAIAIAGSVQKPGSFTGDDIAKLSLVELTVSQQTDKGPSSGTYKGVLLWTLIERAGLVNGPEKNAYLRHVVFVTGADGYQAALSEGEIDPRLEGKQVIVAIQKDGAPLDGFRLVVPGDAHAARGVHDIQTIEVK